MKADDPQKLVEEHQMVVDGHQKVVEGHQNTAVVGLILGYFHWDRQKNRKQQYSISYFRR